MSSRTIELNGRLHLNVVGHLCSIGWQCRKCSGRPGCSRTRTSGNRSDTARSAIVCCTPVSHDCHFMATVGGSHIRQMSCHSNRINGWFLQAVNHTPQGRRSAKQCSTHSGRDKAELLGRPAGPPRPWDSSLYQPPDCEWRRNCRMTGRRGGTKLPFRTVKAERDRERQL